MRKLVRFELKKAMGGRFFPIALCLLLAVNILLNCDIPHFLMLRESVVNGTGIGNETAETYTFWRYAAGNRQFVAAARERANVFARLTPEELADFETAMREKYGEDVFDPYRMDWPDEAFETPGYFSEYPDRMLLSDYSTALDRDHRIAEARESVLPAARSYGREALAHGDNYGIRRNLRIIRLYSVPQVSSPSPVYGWDEFLVNTQSSTLLVSLLLLLVCAGTFSGETERQTWLLLHTAKHGKGRTLAAKYLAGIAAAVGLTVLFQLTALGAVWFRDGLLGAGDAVAAIDELELFPYVMTIWQYALLALACQAFAAAALSVLLTTVSGLSRSSVVSYGAGAALLGGCLLLAYFPPSVEWLRGPLALSAPLRYFSSYYTADIFGFPVLWAVVQAALWCLLGGACAFLAYRLTCRRKREAV